MSEKRSEELQPVAALRRAFVDSAVSSLRSHAALRVVVGIIGALLFFIGVLFAPLWNVPLLSWLSGREVAAPCLAGGLYALGIWYLSRRDASPPANRQPQNSTTLAQSDLAAQLSQLKDLRDSGAITEEEFKLAKARLLQ